MELLNESELISRQVMSARWRDLPTVCRLVFLHHSQADDTNTEDCIYNSFQYWRVPLPELDFLLLGDTSDYSQWEDKSKVEDSPSDVMET